MCKCESLFKSEKPDVKRVSLYGMHSVCKNKYRGLSCSYNDLLFNCTFQLSGMEYGLR